MSGFDSDGLSIMARILWLHMRDEGGWWTAHELLADLWPGEPSPHASTTVAGGLRALVNRGHVAQRRRGALTYGVTGACAPITGCTLQPGEPIANPFLSSTGETPCLKN